MIVIFGGTGTLGHALSRVIVDSCDDPVTIVSRCELRQKDMAKEFPDFDFVVGDVTNKDWAEQLPKARHVFNLAAMKHVDVGESNVRRCVDINYHGTVNTWQWSNSVNAETYSFSSTDKAVLPINAYGMAKSLAERYLYERFLYPHNKSSRISCFRWGNVMGSRGSVFHSFAKTLTEQGKVFVTQKDMTRFWIHIEDVARFMWDKKDVETNQTPHIPNMKGASVLRMAEAIADVIGVNDYEVEFTGIRPGEKIHECLYTSHDYCITSDKCDQFSDAELIQLAKEVLDDSVIGQQGKHGKAIPEHLEIPRYPI